MNNEKVYQIRSRHRKNRMLYRPSKCCKRRYRWRYLTSLQGILRPLGTWVLLRNRLSRSLRGGEKVSTCIERDRIDSFRSRGRWHPVNYRLLCSACAPLMVLSCTAMLLHSCLEVPWMPNLCMQPKKNIIIIIIIERIDVYLIIVLHTILLGTLEGYFDFEAENWEVPTHATKAGQNYRHKLWHFVHLQ